MTAVAASDTWRDPDGVRRPAGSVHAWQPGTNQTLCGLALSRSRLQRFAGTDWKDVQPATGGHADAVQEVCRRCAAATGTRRGEKRWQRTNPRP
ncbi:hypothetical protein GC722_11370 [Auraticoccus sp. F435]|uniref:Uncharacterized protein n=1 Tax=Auraticoccus cholistanensis TaxID=2656650 RepID=A0A6A9UVA6_9ACTN|nr:hypothetical protein [Auraticoccus cholistanensis]MVA76618.1 hypothetical protein [Auraticoccus cholistanensis]